LLCFGSLTQLYKSCEIYYTNLVENIHWILLLWNSFMNGLLWINKNIWMIDGCWIWCLSWCGVFSPLHEFWDWHEVVELLWWWCWCLYMLCAYMLLVNFLTWYWCWIFGESMYSNSRWKCGECMHSWLSHMFTQHMLSQMFTSILPLTGYLYPYSRWNYSRSTWCSVGIRGDDLGGDLVPHVSRVGLGTLHV